MTELLFVVWTNPHALKRSGRVLLVARGVGFNGCFSLSLSKESGLRVLLQVAPRDLVPHIPTGFFRAGSSSGGQLWSAEPCIVDRFWVGERA